MIFFNWFKKKDKKYKQKEEQEQDPYQKIGVFPLNVDIPSLPTRKSYWGIYKFSILIIISLCFSGIVALYLYMKVPEIAVDPVFLTWSEADVQFVRLDDPENADLDKVNISVFDLLAKQFLYKYVKQLYSISDDQAENEARWCDCNDPKNKLIDSRMAYSSNFIRCFICKKSNANIYARFAKNNFPNWYDQAGKGLTRNVEIYRIEHLDNMQKVNDSTARLVYKIWYVDFQLKDYVYNTPVKNKNVQRAYIGLYQDGSYMKVVTFSTIFHPKADYIIENFKPYGEMD